MTEIGVTQLYRKPENGGVVVVSFKAEKKDGEYVASIYADRKFAPDPDAPDFTPFDDLTEADVIGWLEGVEGLMEKIEGKLDDQIAEQKSPPVLKGMPWGNNLIWGSE